MDNLNTGMDVRMSFRRAAVLLMFLLTFLTPCFAHHTAVIVNKDNNTGTFTAVRLAKIFRLEIRKWPDGRLVVLVLDKASAGETKTLEHLNKMSPAAWKALIADHKDAIQIVDSDAAVLKVVQATPGAIGLVDVRAVDGTINVVRVDRKLPMEAGYLPH